MMGTSSQRKLAKKEIYVSPHSDVRCTGEVKRVLFDLLALAKWMEKEKQCNVYDFVRDSQY